MFENIQYKDLPLLYKNKMTLIPREKIETDTEEDLLAEHLLEIYINDTLTMKLICLPENLEELVLGRLLSEGMIISLADVESIYICEFGLRAKVFLTKECTDRIKEMKQSSNKPDDDYVEVTPTCCTGNQILNDLFADGASLVPVTPIEWKKEWIFNLADAFANGTSLHQKTWATHSCFLGKKDQILFSCEDIGRHNAIDKVIGYALKSGIDLKECIVYSSGRIPTDMVIKVIRAGIPVLSSKASPTSQAVELAKEFHLTLICQARRDRMKQYA